VDKFQVFDLAHAIFCAVAFVQVPKPVAWEFRATKAVLAGALGADAHLALHDCLWFDLLRVPASVAGIIFA
jgi:hypothetical protein